MYDLLFVLQPSGKACKCFDSVFKLYLNHKTTVGNLTLLTLPQNKYIDTALHCISISDLPVNYMWQLTVMSLSDRNTALEELLVCRTCNLGIWGSSLRGPAASCHIY